MSNRMKHLFKIGLVSSLSFLLFASSCDSERNSQNCGRFRNGLFRYHSRMSDKGDVLIQRTDSIQTETYLETGLTSKFSVQWTGPCNYELKMLETTHDYPDSIQEIRMKRTLYVEILKWDKDYYLYGISDKKGEIESRDTFWVEKRRRNVERDSRDSLDQGN
jgi:hypothetical protein